MASRRYDGVDVFTAVPRKGNALAEIGRAHV